MGDVTEKLRTAAARGAPGTRNPSDYTASRLSAQDALDAATEIERLRARVESLEADKARLVAALEPFAAVSYFTKNDPDGRIVSIGRWKGDHFYADVQVTAAHFNHARAELDAVKGGGDA